MTTTLRVSETFYSLQGEGARVGEPTYFIRLQGCKAQHACYASGIRCDTEFESGREIGIVSLIELAKASGTKWVTWTGGEPMDQLTPDVVLQFKAAGLKQSVETSGLHPTDGCEFDFVTVSPKVAEHVVKKNFPNGVTELRYVRHSGQDIPVPSISAEYLFISPHFSGKQMDIDNVQHCIDLCLKNPAWRLSVQQHKLWNVL